MEGAKCHCGQAYNQMDRQMIILPCGDRICLLCFEKLIQPQESKLICPYDQEEVQISQKFKDSILLVKQQSLAMWIICEEHNQKVEYYCQQDKKLICLKCLLTHQDHINQITEIKQGEVDDYLGLTLELLVSFKERTEKACEQIQIYLSKAKSYSSSEFLDIAKEAQHLFLLISGNPYQNNDLELFKGLVPKFDLPLQPQVMLPILSNDNIFDFDEHTLRTFQITDQDQQLLQQWLGGNAKLQLLYSGTRDGDTAQKFHELCDNKGPTLTVVMSEMGYVFGGYTGVSWSSDQDKWKEDKNAFLYSLTHKTQHKVIQDQAQYAVFHGSKYLSVYGSGGNFTINDNFIRAATSHTDAFGTNYQLTYGIQPKTDQSRRYLSGTKETYFYILEAEVYLVTR